MKIAIVKERRPHETRVAATPETVKKLKALGVEEIVIEAGAGTAASYTDQAYTDAGAMIVPDAAAAGTLFTGWGFSIITSAAFLSSLKPWKEGCRIWPSSVHSVKVTSQSKTGLTQ